MKKPRIRKGSKAFIAMMKEKVCPGCRYNRYNLGVGYQESEHDAPVTVTECWVIQTCPQYNRRSKTWLCMWHPGYKASWSKR